MPPSSDAIGNNHQALLLYNYLCNRHPFSIAYRYGRALLLVFHPNLSKDETLVNYFQSDINYLEKIDIQRTPKLKNQVRYIRTVHSVRAIDEKNDPSLSEIRNAIKEALDIENNFAETDEEYSTLKILIACTYRKAWCCISTKASSDISILFEAYDFFQCAFLYLARYALTLQRTAFVSGKSPLSDLFVELMQHGGMIERLAACNNVNLTDNNRKFVTPEATPPEAILMLNIILSCIHVFEPHMNKQKREVQERISLHEKHFSSAIVLQNLKEIAKDEIKPSIIKHSGNIAILIKLNWKIPSAIVFAWAQHHDIEARVAVDSKLKVCLYFRLNSHLTRRANYQPTPNPNSFLTIKHLCAETTNQPYFLGLSHLFKECLDAIKSWRPDPKKRISYHFFGNETCLPSLLLVQRDEKIRM